MSSLRNAATMYDLEEDPRFDLGDRQQATEEAIRADVGWMLEIDSDAFGYLSYEEGTEMLATLADAKDVGLIDRLACGDAANDLSPRQLDVFAKLAELAERMAFLRQEEVEREVDRRMEDDGF